MPHRAVALLQEAVAAARNDGVAQERLTIGTMETTIAARPPDVVEAYHSKHPAVKLVARTGSSAEFVQRVSRTKLTAPLPQA